LNYLFRNDVIVLIEGALYMTGSEATPHKAGQPKAERMPRGTLPPALKLSEAITLARKVNDNAGGSATYDLFSQITGNTKTSSSFSRKVGALRQFGIIEDRDNVVTLSEIGNRIATPRSEVDDALAAKESLLRIDVLNKIYERHRGRLLPEDQFLGNILIQEMKIPRDVSVQWVEFFKDAAQSAKLLFARPDGKIQILDEPNGGSSLSSFASPVLVSTSAGPDSDKPKNHDLDFSSGALPIPLGPEKIAFINCLKVGTLPKTSSV
jgi:hypothetical protein